jgi:hypothetical protein
MTSAISVYTCRISVGPDVTQLSAAYFLPPSSNEQSAVESIPYEGPEPLRMLPTNHQDDFFGATFLAFGHYRFGI